MKVTHSVFIPLACLFFMLPIGAAQEGVISSGGNYITDGGSVSFSLGQPMDEYLSGTGGNVQQGLQQPSSGIMVSVENDLTAASIRLYPNPVSDMSWLEIEDKSTAIAPGQYSYTITDISGRIIFHDKINTLQTEISFHDLKPGVYIILIRHHRQKMITFKVIKA